MTMSDDTRRKLFAAVAMHAILTAPSSQWLDCDEDEERVHKTVAQIAVEYADALASRLDAGKVPS